MLIQEIGTSHGEDYSRMDSCDSIVDFDFQFRHQSVVGMD